MSVPEQQEEVVVGERLPNVVDGAYPPSRKDHEVIGGPITISATVATEHIGSFTASFTATLAGFDEEHPSLLFEFVVSGSGSPTITLAGATFAFATTQNLTGLADGTYQAVFNSVDDGTNVTVYVKLMP